jgi:hypothetical protein
MYYRPRYEIFGHEIIINVSSNCLPVSTEPHQAAPESGRRPA